MTEQVYGSSRADRALSFKVADFPVPQGTEEEWRFTPLERMEDFFADTATGAAPKVTVSGAARVEKVGRDDERLGKLSAPEDRTGALAWEAFTEAYVVTVPRGEKIDEEILVNVAGDGSKELSALHVLVDVEPLAEATIIMSHTGSARVTEGVEINVGDGAHLTFVTTQEWDDDAAQTLSNRIHVGRDSTLKHIVVTYGGDLVRMTTSVDFQDQGADVNLLGAYYVDAGQHLEHRLFVDHNKPNCSSNVTYKGALQGQDAQSVWIGDVLIRKEGKGTDSYELNRNLVLTEGTRADSVPNLEIETGEIESAGHASTTGRFDEQQLFYLMSRGIPEDEARRLVVRGFFAELINQIGVESVENKLMGIIEAELDLTMGDSND